MDFNTNTKLEAIKDDISSSPDLGEEEPEEVEESDFIEESNGQEIPVEPEGEDEEDEDLPPAKKSVKPSMDDQTKKKLLKMMIFVVIGIIVLFFLFYVVTLLTGGGRYKYEDVEEIMQEAAESYFEENKTKLPQTEDTKVEINVSTLVAAERMKSLSDYLGEETKCTGKVVVRKSGDDYMYTPFLDCGDEYSTKLLADEVAKDEKLVGSGYGLYYINDNYVFRGEIVDNYVKLGNDIWRIVRVNSDRTITLVYNKTTVYTYPYDDRYNQSMDFEYGINNYETSRAKETLDKIYKTEDKDDYEYYIFNKEDKKYLVDFDLCIGKMDQANTVYNNSKECLKTIKTKIGLLTVSDFITASIDTGCSISASDSCENYNYLANESSFWLATPDSKDTYSVYTVRGGAIKSQAASELEKLRPVITLSSNTLIKDGDGSEEKPYTLR